MTTVLVQNICDLLESLAPASLAEPWDNIGLLAGSPETPVSSILVGLDPVDALIDEAVEKKADLIITHHPVIFHPLKALRTDQPVGRILARALANGITMIASHTNLDAAENGVNDILADRLGLDGSLPLTPNDTDHAHGLGRVGKLSRPLAGQEFLTLLLDALGLSQVRLAGAVPETVTKIAVCGGSGDDLTRTAFNAGADIYITGEIKLSTARWAEAAGFCVVDAGHYATEAPVVEHLVKIISAQLNTQGRHLPVLASTRQTDHFTLFHHPLQPGKLQP